MLDLVEEMPQATWQFASKDVDLQVGTRSMEGVITTVDELEGTVFHVILPCEALHSALNT